MAETAVADPVKDQFVSQLKPVAGASDAAIRQEAINTLENLRVPTTRDEYWKYTRIASVLKGEYADQPEVTPADLSKLHIPNLDCTTLVFVNGNYVPALSSTLEDGAVRLMPLSAAKEQLTDLVEAHLSKQDAGQNGFFDAVNTAYHKDGFCLYVQRGTQVEKPIHILQVTQGEMVVCNPRHLIVVGDNSEATVIHSYRNLDGKQALTNAVSEMTVGANAKLDYHLIQKEGDQNAHINSVKVTQGRSSRFSIHTITTEGKMVRNNLNIVVDGEGCETNLNGLYLTKDKQHVDNHTLVDHLLPHCESNETYKGILNDQSTGVFNGKVFVRQDAQKTNAFQSNQNILLTDDATINSKPELEIYADDVKCSHGSTTGQMDEEALFYLRSRGIGETEARKLLVKAFAADVLGGIELEPLREWIEQSISERYDNVLSE